MTPAALLMLWVHDQITFDGYVWAMNELYPVAATPPAHAYRPLAELAPTLMAMQAADAVMTELQAA